MLNQLEPVSSWEYIFLFLLTFICFLIGYFFAKWHYKNKLEKCANDREMLEDKLLAHREKHQDADTEAKPKVKLNFESFGKAEESQKDDLKIITGVGPFIEKKLNGIGIYTYDQISRFTAKDIEEVTELIEFFPGRIERDGWTKQAKKLKT